MIIDVCGGGAIGKGMLRNWQMPGVGRLWAMGRGTTSGGDGDGGNGEGGEMGRGQ